MVHVSGRSSEKLSVCNETSVKVVNFFAVGMSQTDFLVQFLNTYLGYETHAFAAVLFSRK